MKAKTNWVAAVVLAGLGLGFAPGCEKKESPPPVSTSGAKESMDKAATEAGKAAEEGAKTVKEAGKAAADETKKAAGEH